MIAFLALIRKDLQIFLQDRRAVIMAFVAPIIIGSFFGYVFGGSTYQSGTASRAKLLVTDQDNSPISQAIVNGMMAASQLDVSRVSFDEARSQIQKGNASVAMIIPPAFGRQVMFQAAQRPKLTFFVDPSHEVEAKMIEGLVTGRIAAAMNHGAPPPFETAEVPVTVNRNGFYNPYAHSFGGMAIQFILFLGIDVGIGMLTDRQRGLWKRFASSPLSKWTLVGSRVVSATVMVCMILAVVFAFARLVFGVKIEGSLLGFAGVCIAFGLMTSSYGLVIAALGKTPQGARGLSILATLLMVMLSGAWIPSFLFPKWLRDMTKVVPARWAMDGLDGMSWRGLGFSEAVLPILVLLGFAAVFALFAISRFRWETE